VKVSLQSGTIHQLGTHVAVVTIENESTAPSKQHTIKLLDCSGSMAGSLDDVRDDAIRFVNELGPNDFVSVIIYSGHNSAELIAGPTACTREGTALLSRAIKSKVRVMGTTVFSEPLEKALATAKMLTEPGMAHNAVLFTDGCPVPTRWSGIEEFQRTRDVCNDLYKAEVSVSVIGYGMHYDEDFIRMIMSISGNTGIFRHISEIEDFRDTIEDIRMAFAKTALTDARVTLTPPEKSGRGILRVLRATPNVVACTIPVEIRLNSFYENKATFFVELSQSLNRLGVKIRHGKTEEEFLLIAEPLSDQSMQEYVRVCGAHAFLSGNREEAAELLQLVGEDLLADQVTTSYSAREQRETSDRVRRVFRNREFIGAGLKPAGPSHCVLNVLRTLIEDPECVVYIPRGAYKRSGLLTKDPRVIENPHGRTLRVVGYTSHESRFNFSVRTLKDVKVRPEGGGVPIDTHVYRTYNVILDGNLHLPELEAAVSGATFQLLHEAGVIAANMTYGASRTYTLNLRNLRLISSNWANPRTLGLVSLLREEADLEDWQKVLNLRLRGLNVERPEFEGAIYHESAAPVEKREYEYYSASCIEVRLMKYKSPSIAVVRDLSAEETLQEVRRVRRRLTAIRFLTRAITFAMETVGSKSIQWGAPKETSRGTYTKTERLAAYDGAQLKRVNWTEEAVCS